MAYAALLGRVRQVCLPSQNVCESRNLQSRFRRYPQINSLEENNAFCEFVTNLLKDQSVVLPVVNNHALNVNFSQQICDPKSFSWFVTVVALPPP